METKYAVIKFLKTKSKVVFEKDSLKELRQFIEWDFRKKVPNDVTIEKFKKFKK